MQDVLFFSQLVSQPAKRDRGNPKKRSNHGMGYNIFEKRVSGSEINQPLLCCIRSEKNFKIEVPDKFLFYYCAAKHFYFLVLVA